MTLKNIENSWQLIVNNTMLLEQNAADENWAVVSELAANRHQSISKHFECFPVGPDTAEFYQHHLSHFLKKEESLQKLTLEARKTAIKASIQLTNNKKAMNVYREA